MIPVEHQSFIDRAVGILGRDARIAGAALGGSYITGNMDEFSDLDFVIAINPADTAGVMNDRMRIAESLGTLLCAFTGEHVGEPRLLICLYDSPLLHVDLKFVSLDDIGKRVEDPAILFEREGALTKAFSKQPAVFPVPDPQWIEDRFWVWVHYGAGKIGRGELFEAIGHMDFLRQTAIAPLIQIKDGRLPRGVRNIETSSPEYLPALLNTVAAHDAESCVWALRAAVGLYLRLRESYLGSLTVRRAAQGKALEYLDEITARIGNN